MKILFVENHAIFANIVTQEFLSEHEVEIVPTIEKAFERVFDEVFDVLLADYDLDDGNGGQLVKEIRKKGYLGKIIAVSSHRRGNKLLLQAGADAICSKMEFHNITDVISQLFQSKGNSE